MLPVVCEDLFEISPHHSGSTVAKKAAAVPMMAAMLMLMQSVL